MQLQVNPAELSPIPVIDCGTDFPFETLLANEAEANALLDVATRGIPAFALRQLDRASRRWLWKWSNAHLDEIDRIAKRLDRPGAYFFSVNYEWGCTCRVAPSPDGTSARLIRVLDWRTPGLGRNVVAARVTAPAGRYVAMTWPGYTGVLTAVAPGRFSAALNQAPMRKAVGTYYLDWAANRRRVWHMPHPTPSHLLRDVMDAAATYADARRRLISDPISTPAIFSLAGLKPQELCVIERTETEARVHDGANVAANHWQAPGWSGHARGVDSALRACRMHAIPADLDPAFPWLEPPILNPHTRIVMVADAQSGELVAQGFEDMSPATAPLRLVA
ncbi:MAG: hypothetical protein ACT4N2_07415 [Hyphomicrobium sp.]